MKLAVISSSIVALLVTRADAFSSVDIASNGLKPHGGVRHLTSLTAFKRKVNVVPLFATTEKTRQEEETDNIIEFLEPRILVECEETEDLANELVQNWDGEDDRKDIDAEMERRRRAAIAARVLKKDVSQSSVRSMSGTILRGGRSSAATAAAAKKKAKTDKATGGNDSSSDAKGNSVVKKNIIQSTIDALIEAQNQFRALEKPMGLLGGRTVSLRSNLKESEEISSPHLELPTKPNPGTILVDRTATGSKSSMLQAQRIKDQTCVRVATVADDLEIAKLRLSVFSDFSPEVRDQFRTRSCEVLDHRRLKGATCLVASVKYSDVDLEFELEEGACPHTWIIGGVECSTHEFAGTKLGLRRPGGSILYITEVAVSPRARRSGAGTLLLKVRMIDSDTGLI